MIKKPSKIGCRTFTPAWFHCNHMILHYFCCISKFSLAELEQNLWNMTLLDHSFIWPMQSGKCECRMWSLFNMMTRQSPSSSTTAQKPSFSCFTSYLLPCASTTCFENILQCKQNGKKTPTSSCYSICPVLDHSA